MIEHRRFCVMECLDLDQRERATDRVLRTRLPQHQSFPAERFNPGELVLQMVESGAAVVRQCFAILMVTRQQVRERLEPRFEFARRFRRVEDEVPHFFPVIAFVLPTHDADRALKLFAVDPQFAIEWSIRQAIDKPIWRVIFVSLPRKKPLAVPIRAHAIELLAHPPTGEIRRIVPRLREQNWRTIFLAGAFDRLIWQRTDAFGFRVIAAQFSQVFARSLFDGRGLVSPRRAGAGINAAGVFENVRFRARALHFGRFAIGKISHVVFSRWVRWSLVRHEP